MPEPWFYRNIKSFVAFSLDEGETVCIPSGRVLPWSEAWEETMDDLGNLLTPAQKQVLKKMQQAAQERSELTGIDKMVADFEDRTKVERARHQWKEKPKEYRKLPEHAQVVSSDPKD